MGDALVGFLFLLAAAAGVGLARFNPALAYSRRGLFWTATLATAMVAALIFLLLDGSPLHPPSGVANLDGG